VRNLACRPAVEVSGGVRLDNVRSIALCGPDFISVGLITHSSPSLDISLDF
jgi:nicotinate-nucleotide pyrophosphorylase (carboxylating)